MSAVPPPPEPAVAWRSWPVVVGLLAGLLQVNFLLENVLPGSLPLGTSLVSELSAPSQPWTLAYRAGDLLAGLLTLEVGRLLLRGWRGRLGLLTALLALVYGAGLAVSAVVPSTCDDRLGRCGGHVLLTGAAPLADRVHDLLSIVSSLGLLVASVTGCVVLVRLGLGRRGRLLLGVGAVTAALGGVALVQTAVGLTGGQGVVQRVQVALTSLLVVQLAEGLQATRDLRRRAARGRPAVTRPAGGGAVVPRSR